MKMRVSIAIMCLVFSFMVFIPTETSMANGDEDEIVINEIMYDPEGTDTGFEWIELYNNGSNTVNMMDWMITDQDGDDDFTFPDLDFPPGAYIVVNSGSGMNETDFSDGNVFVYMWKTSTLFENSGDDVLLLNKTGEPVDYVAFDYGTSVDPCPPGLPWDDLNGWVEDEGNSLSLHPGGHDTDSGLSWEESDPTPGFPNAHLYDAPPTIGWVFHGPLNPGSNEFVTITANVTDDYSLDRVSLHYSINRSACPTVSMNREGINFTAQIPAMSLGTVIDYHVTASDDAQQVSSSARYSFAYSDSQVLLVINEFLPDPGSDWNGDGYVDSHDEWIELYNPGDMIVNVGGWILDDMLGPSGSSDPYMIPPGLAVGPHDFVILYGNETEILLNNNGDNVTLIDDEGFIVDLFSYSDSANDSAQGRFPDGSENWRSFLLPTPKEANKYTVDTLENLSHVKINEYLPRPGSIYSTEWVELYNAGDSPARLDGCYLDDVIVGGKSPFRIPLNTTLGPGEFWMHSAGLGLNNDGDSINLLYVDGTTLIDGHSYESSEYDISHGRSLDGGAEWSSFSFPTPQAPNTPLVWPDGNERGVIITELFYKATDAFEFLTVHNPTNHEVDISGWRIADSPHSYSGTLVFPQDTLISKKGTIRIAHNASIHHHITGTYPDLECDDSMESIPNLLCRDIPGFSNEGDAVLLTDEFGNTIDCVVFGDSGYEDFGWEDVPVGDVTKGEILVRNRNLEDTGFVDTNSSSDWVHIRHHKLGQSDVHMKTFSSECTITAFASPDSSYGTLVSEIKMAESSIHLSLYQFTNWRLAQELLCRLNDSVEVHILLEGGPAGGWEEQQQYICQKIVEYGGCVRFMVHNSTLGSRYRYLHAKYAIIDENSVIISSENWKDTGIPVDSSFGNRGWGVVIRDWQTAEYFEGLFSSDWNDVSYDIIPFTCEDPKYGNASPDFIPDQWVEEGYYGSPFPSKTVEGDFKIVTVISPDMTVSDEDPILNTINSAQNEILIEQLDLDLNWNEDTVEYDNLYLQAAIRAAEERQVRVKILLSSLYTSPDDPCLDNYDTCVYINAYAANHNLSDHLEARLADYDRLGLSKVHNKGMIVDGNKTLVSSINWVRNSVTQNREVGVIIENRQIAEYFTELFYWDWNEPPQANAGEDVTAIAGQDIGFSDMSWDSDENDLTCLWEFDDGTNSTQRNPVKRFAQPGVYDVFLTVSDGQYSDSHEVTVIVLEAQNEEVGDVSAGLAGLLLVTFICIIAVIIVFIRRMRLQLI